MLRLGVSKYTPRVLGVVVVATKPPPLSASLYAANNHTLFTRSYYKEGNSRDNRDFARKPRFNNSRGGDRRQDGDRFRRGNDRSSSNSNKYFESRQRNYASEESDTNVIDFQKGTLAKLVYVPKQEPNEKDAEGNSTDVTLQQLLDKEIIDTSLFKSIERMGFAGLTPVQQKTIEPILSNAEDDIITRAKTGTGKTFAFLIPIFQHLINSSKDSQYMVRSVIIAPTRDLALQIEAEVRKIHKNNYDLEKFSCVSLVGGTNIQRSLDFMHRKRPSIVIATPGRFIDIMERVGPKFFKFVDFKVLDEADRLLEIGFKQDLEFISKNLNEINENGPKHVRTLLFSATLDEKVQNLANNIMNKEKCLFIDTVDKNEPEAHEKIAQSLVVSENYADNLHASIRHIRAQLLESAHDYKGILFTPTVKFTKLVSKILYKEFGNQIPIHEFHGQITQSRRTNLVNAFKRDKSGLLICTDVAARGMDFPNVKEVLQIGVPTELSNYIHRIGRTARSGKEGRSVIFLCEEELPFINELRSKKNIEIVDKTEFESTVEEREQLAAKFRYPEDLADSVVSLISYYRSCIKEYRLREREMLPQIAMAYGSLLNDSEKRLPISRNMIDRLGFARNPLAKKMFEVKTHEHSSEDREFNDEPREDNYVRRSNYSRGDGSRNNNNRPRRSYNSGNFESNDSYSTRNNTRNGYRSNNSNNRYRKDAEATE
ncbi:ATP-dependent RNA helicase Mss116p, mitochondrial [Monosporozyma servazzii]